MPRINVEDSIFRDPRWFGLLRLVDDPEGALGKLVLFWFLAQKYWQNGEQLVPRNVIPLALEPVIQAGFAEERKDGVYVCGSREHFSWLEKRREAGRLGGIASAKQKQANSSKSKQTQPSSSSKEKKEEEGKGSMRGRGVGSLQATPLPVDNLERRELLRSQIRKILSKSDVV